jgi:Predicted ATPase with chaperone activity
VIEAQARQYHRQGQLNARLGSSDIRRFCALCDDDALWLEQTLTALGLSIRAWQRLLKVSRTIADLEEVDAIARHHLQEALSYRGIDRVLIHLQKLLH